MSLVLDVHLSVVPWVKNNDFFIMFFSFLLLFFRSSTGELFPQSTFSKESIDLVSIGNDIMIKP